MELQLQVTEKELEEFPEEQADQEQISFSNKGSCQTSSSQSNFMAGAEAEVVSAAPQEAISKQPSAM